MLTLHSSHRLELLAGALAEILRDSPAPPLVPETVVVQSLGMRRWLSLQLAGALGVAMNIRFPFPAEFAEDMFAAHLGARPSPVFHRDALPWRIHAALPAMLDDPDFRDLREYAAEEPLRLWQLATQVAAAFDRYLAHRPELLLRWDAGEIADGERWQSKLWRRIAHGHPHPAAMLAALDERPVSDVRLRNASRSFLFGIGALAPLYVKLLEALTDRAEIHLFLLVPTREYWGDIRSEREQARFARWREKRGNRGDFLPFEQGHPLLASLGKVGREFHEAMLDLIPGAEHEYSEPRPSATALTRLQNDILALAERAPAAIASSDRSIQFHNCHSPLRELEVLLDQLLALFEREPSLEPRDVLVAVPDIEAYAPFIEAVFGATESDAVRFPYSIADRPLRTESGVADAFLRLLGIVGSRFAATELLALLDCPAIRVQFHMTEGDLSLIRRWVATTGIRWGRDAAHRASLDLPAREENTWRFGLDRLLLGFALPGDGATLFGGILPSPESEGALASTLGCLATFCDRLFSRVMTLSAPRTAAEWSRDLHDLLMEFCSAADEFAGEWRAVAASIADLATVVTGATQDLAGASSAIPFNVIHRHISTVLTESDRGSGFLRGGVTFCSLRPMRAIPHRIVCLLGLNDGAFPRHERTPAFDLTSSRPQPGDRTIRDDDRYLFLEAILSARDTFYVSWCGQSPRDNSAIPPSVVVSEFHDHLVRVFTPAPAISMHRLQAFSSAYFAGGDLFSYSTANATAAYAAASTRTATAKFGVSLSPSVAADLPFEISMASLTDALTHPARAFARDTLGLRLPVDEPAPEDVEPLELDGLERYRLATDLVDAHCDGADISSRLPALAAAGVLPHGYAGVSAFHDAATSAQLVASAIAHHAPGPARLPLQLIATVANWQISATLRVITDTALIHARPASLRSRDFLRAWISHLVLCTAADATPRRTVLVGNDEAFTFDSLGTTSAHAALESLLALYARLRHEPLPFFLESSLAFAEYSLNIGGRRKADPIEQARKCWHGSQYPKITPEAGDPWNALVWRGAAEPLGDDFRKLALTVFEPLLRHRVALSGAPEP